MSKATAALVVARMQAYGSGGGLCLFELFHRRCRHDMSLNVLMKQLDAWEHDERSVCLEPWFFNESRSANLSSWLQVNIFTQDHAVRTAVEK